MPCYRAFGLRLRADESLRVFPHGLPTALWDVDISLGTAPPADHAAARLIYQWGYSDGDGLRVWLAGDGRLFRFLYADGAEFFISSAGNAVWATWPPAMTFESMLTYLLGPIMGFVLRLRGVTALHASAVAVGGRALALVGDAGAGKSTTAAAFALRGFPVLSDDIVPLRLDGDAVSAIPAYPQLRLWESSVEMLYDAPDALPLLAPDWDKRALNLVQPGYRFQAEPLPLGAIYLLEARDPGLTAPAIAPLAPRDALIALSANTYAHNLLDKTMRAREFEFLNDLVRRVPVRRLTPPADPTCLPALCDGILADFAALTDGLEIPPLHQER